MAQRSILTMFKKSDGAPNRLENRTGNPVEIDNRAGNPVELDNRAGNPVEIACDIVEEDRTGNPVEIDNRAGNPVELDNRAGNPVEIGCDIVEEDRTGNPIESVRAQTEGSDELTETRTSQDAFMLMFKHTHSSKSVAVISKKRKRTASSSSDLTPTTKKANVGESSQSTDKQFTKTWHAEFDWLLYENDAMFCTLCIKHKNKSKFSQSGSVNFHVSTLREHDSSSGHVKSVKMETEVLAKRIPSVKIAISKKADQIEGAVCRLIRTAYTIGKNNIPVHKYKELCELQICNDTNLTRKLYQDKNACTEFIEIISYLFDDILLEKLRASPAIGIMIDESTDRSNEKHLIVYVNYLNDGILHTSYMSLIKIVSADANAVYSSVVGYLKAGKIDLSKLFGFSSDGAAVMMGKDNGVAAKLKTDNPYMLDIHCIAHRLALSSLDAAKQVREVKYYESMLHTLHSFFSRSSKRLEHLRIWQEILDDPKVKPLAVHQIRWLSFSNCVTNVRRSLPSLLKSLESDSEDDIIASSLFQAMSTYKFLYLTHFFCDIMGDIAVVSRIFQNREIDYATIKTTVSAVCDSIEQQYLVEEAQYNEKRDELLVILKKECHARIDEHYDNVAFVVLGSLDISTEDEEYITALDNKYDVLRKRIFLMALKEQLDWRDLSKEDKQAAIRDIIKQEKLLRSECKFHEMEHLVGPKVKILPALRNLMGEDKAECQRRKNQQKDDEDPVDLSKVINVLADLVPRYDNEQEFLLAWLHSPEAKSLSLRMRRMMIVKMKVETYRVEMEEEFEIAALSEGLMERVMDTLAHRHGSDKERQSLLARKRVQLRSRRIQQDEEYSKEPEISKDKIPQKGDLTGLQAMYLREMLKRHTDEREVTLYHLQDESIDELIEAASTMSENERQQRLAELQGKRQNLNLTMPDDKDEHESILEEAAALRAVSMKQQLVMHGETANIEAIAMAMLAELQEEQDREVALTLSQIENMNEEDIRTCLDREINNRRLGTAWNVINVFTRYQGEATDDLLLKALEKKYNVLQEKLLVDSLRIRIGTDQWEQLSQKERQHKLMALDSQAQEQLRLGHVQPSLLGEEFHLPESVTQMMGVCPHVFKNKVKGQIVTGNQSNLHMDEDAGVVSKKGEPGSLLKDLYTRFEEEKHALVRQLKGQTEDYFSEKERQIQLARYHRESVLASQETTFVLTATWVGLMERQQEEVKFRLLKDKQRYEKVARKVMADIQKGGQQTELASDSARAQSTIELLDAVMVQLENKHLQERQLFHRLVQSTNKYGDLQQQAAMSTQQQILDKMSDLKESRKKSVQDRKCENLEVLTEATVYKKEARRGHMTAETDDITEEDLCTSLMADLLEYQNCEAQRALCLLAQQSEGEILQYQNKIQQDKKSNMADNIAMVVLSPERADGASEDDLIEALKGKYDALKDKLLAEALMKELGDTEWNRMSEKERQRRVFDLKLKEKQLRKAGEANALLAELLKDQEHLRQLMGDSAQDQRQKLQDRLRRRKERHAEGMSEEEIDQLEKEDIEREEEEGRNKKRNIIEDLDQRFEQEKDELLRRLNAADDDLERERERQSNLARLRRDQRLARKEDNFGSAALILGLAEKHDKDLRLSKDEERERQEKLARERLEAARERRHRGIKDDDDDSEMHVVNTDDPASVQEAIARDMDSRHRHEREFFMKLLEESVDGKHRKSAQAMSHDERDDKMFELAEIYKHWLNSDNKNVQEQMDILKEAATCKLEMLMVQAEADGRQVTSDDLQVALLADLQEHQKREAQRLLNNIENTDLQGLQQLHRAMSLLNKDGGHDNVASVLLGDRLPGESSEEEAEEGETTEASVMKALEQKYDAIKDQLLVEALMKEHGEREWAQMTEKQRQKKLIDLKLKERRLRKAGKLDEIANIIGSHLENEKLLDELMGDSKKSQKKRLEERLARKRELIADRQSEGLSTDDATIETIIQEEEVEEEKRKRRNILENLEQNFEDEKLRLLRTLSNQRDKVTQERQRQLELAKLKRDERRMQKGQKLQTAAMIINSAKEDDKKREQGIEAERERQQNIARERLEARKRKKHGAPLNAVEMEQKLNEDEERAKLDEVVKQAEGESIYEALMTTVENKQEEEMDMLMALLDLARGDKQQTTKVSSRQNEELKSELARLDQEQMRWRKRSAQMVADLDETNLTVEASHEHMAEVAQNRSNLIKILTDALMCRLEVEHRILKQKEPDMSGDKMEEELQVAMVTDLQEKQTSESRAIQHLMENQNDEMLREMKKSQHVACREGWFDNLTRTVFHVSSAEGGMEEQETIEDKFQENMAQMEAEFEAEREKEIQKARSNAAEGEVIDAEAIKQRLMQEYDDKKQAVMDDMVKQKEAMIRKLSVQRMSREQKDYEELAVRSMLKLAEDQMNNAQENVEQERGKQSNLLQQRLAERRDARKEAKNVRGRENTLDYDGEKSSNSRASTKDAAISPFGAMRREKTVVDVDVSEEEKQAMITSIMRQQKNLQNKITEQQKRQEEMLKRRLRARQGKQEDEAAELFSLGERQKTNLEASKRGEKERQLQKMKEKVSRIREQREPSPAGPKKKE